MHANLRRTIHVSTLLNCIPRNLYLLDPNSYSFFFFSRRAHRKLVHCASRLSIRLTESIVYDASSTRSTTPCCQPWTHSSFLQCTARFPEMCRPAAGDSASKARCRKPTSRPPPPNLRDDRGLGCFLRGLLLLFSRDQLSFCVVLNDLLSH